MSVVVTTAPEPIISVAEARKHVRFSAPDDDPYLVDLVLAVTDYLDGPKGRLGRAIGLQVLEERRPAFPPGICGGWASLAIPAWCWDDERFVVQVPPIVSLVSITYAAANGGQDVALDVADVRFDEDQIEPDLDGGGWPLARYSLNSVRVRYQAGYEEVPAAIKHAALLMLGTLYANREADIATAFSGAAANLLSPYAKVV